MLIPEVNMKARPILITVLAVSLSKEVGCIINLKI